MAMRVAETVATEPVHAAGLVTHAHAPFEAHAKSLRGVPRFNAGTTGSALPARSKVAPQALHLSACSKLAPQIPLRRSCAALAVRVSTSHTVTGAADKGGSVRPLRGSADFAAEQTSHGWPEIGAVVRMQGGCEAIATAPPLPLQHRAGHCVCSPRRCVQG